MSYEPHFRITSALLRRAESIAALRERIQGAAVQVPWIPALQKDTRARNTHSSTAIEGNPLTLAEVRALEEGTTVTASVQARREVLNDFAGMRHVEKQSRANFQEKLEELIAAYNAGSKNIEQVFEELLALSRDLSTEQQRHVRESMSEEELVIFDILTRPAPELSTEERGEVKKVARDLLGRLKLLLVLNWRQKSSARSQLKLAIEDVLDGGLPRAYDKPLYEQKCTALFEHVYESYPERDAGVYAG